MALFIDRKLITGERAIRLICNPDNLVQQIVTAWCRSNIDHEFKSKNSFRKAVRTNAKFLRSPDRIRTFFTRANYCFSTKAQYRKETLYFKDRKTKETGRLRQEHESGPLVKINKKRKHHRFVSKRRLAFLKHWHEAHPCSIPRFCSYEKQPKDGKHHIDFAIVGKEPRYWHTSEGTVLMNDEDLDTRIASALENILGITCNDSGESN
jgi:hypothetical protein